MEGIFKHNDNCFDVYMSGYDTTDTDELLGKALKYLKDRGFSVNLKGFDKYNRALVEINGEIHSADKNLACCLAERFINVKDAIEFTENTERYNKITQYLC